MGRLSLRDMIDNNVGLDNAINWHLRYNHIPPVNPAFIAVAKAAINKAKLDLWNEDINIKEFEGLSNFPREYLPVHKIIEDLHLDEFLVDTEEYEYDE